jgi:hypothetical protein
LAAAGEPRFTPRCVMDERVALDQRGQATSNWAFDTPIPT